MAVLTGLTYHETQCVKTNKFKKKESLTQMERVGYEINCFIRNIRVFGFDKTKEAYKESGDSYVRPTLAKDEIAGKVFHSHFGSKPTYILEYQVLRDLKTVIITGLYTHENPPFQKKLLDSNLFLDCIKQAQEKVKELHVKQLTYNDVFNDYKITCKAAKTQIFEELERGKQELDIKKHLKNKQSFSTVDSKYDFKNNIKTTPNLINN